jgi:hypothetical protein
MYATRYSLRVPDLRAMFLRGMAESRDDYVDPDGKTRRVGEPQAFSTALPRKEFTLSTDGVHAHKYPGTEDVGHVGKAAGAHQPGGSANPAYGSAAMSEAGGHAHTLGGGDHETRPNNVAVYYYIRINP